MTGVTTTILLRNDYSCYVMNQAIQSVPVFIARPHNGKKSVSLLTKINATFVTKVVPQLAEGL